MSLPCPLPLDYRPSPWVVLLLTRCPVAFLAGAGRIASPNRVQTTRISIQFAVLVVKVPALVRFRLSDETSRLQSILYCRPGTSRTFMESIIYCQCLSYSRPIHPRFSTCGRTSGHWVTPDSRTTCSSRRAGKPDSKGYTCPTLTGSGPKAG